MSAIRAITFDLWDTIVRDDSDEPRRSRLGLPSKHETRRQLLWQALDEIEPIEYGAVAQAYDVADAAFRLNWKEEHITWRLEQRLRIALDGLGRILPASVFENLVKRTGEMEVEVPPDLIEGVEAALQNLSQRYPLAICSDAIVTPGTELRRLLDNYGLKRYFSAFAFSDEIGRSKPDITMFQSVADELGVALDEIVHIGDRDHNDIKGPQAIGARAILFTASRPDDRARTSADAICDNYSDLPRLIDQLAGTATVV